MHNNILQDSDFKANEPFCRIRELIYMCLQDPAKREFDTFFSNVIDHCVYGYRNTPVCDELALWKHGFTAMPNRLFVKFAAYAREYHEPRDFMPYPAMIGVRTPQSVRNEKEKIRPRHLQFYAAVMQYLMEIEDVDKEGRVIKYSPSELDLTEFRDYKKYPTLTPANDRLSEWITECIRLLEHATSVMKTIDEFADKLLSSFVMHAPADWSQGFDAIPERIFVKFAESAMRQLAQDDFRSYPERFIGRNDDARFALSEEEIAALKDELCPYYILLHTAIAEYQAEHYG